MELAVCNNTYTTIQHLVDKAAYVAILIDNQKIIAAAEKKSSLGSRGQMENF